LAEDALSRAGWDRGDESDVFVALVRSAIIISVSLAPTLGLLQQTPPELQIATIVGAVYTLALFVARLVGRWLPLQRPLAVAVDLYLVTAAVYAAEGQAPAIFQLYYIVVIVAAMWFGRRGAMSTAIVAIGVYVWALVSSSRFEMGMAEIVWLLWQNGAPVLLILALVSSYVLRAWEMERAQGLRFAHEIGLARWMQRQMLPEEMPNPPGFEIAVRMEVARVVGGDLYDFVEVDDSRLLLWVADVAGKGVHGMMHVSMMNSHLRVAALEGLSPAAIADRVNRGVYDVLGLWSFATVFIAELELETGRLTYTNCGHPHPLLLRGGRTDRIERLHTNTPLIGATAVPRYLQLTTTIEPGDVMVVTTDGVEEARAEDGTLFTEERLITLLSEFEGASASEIASGIIRAVSEFSGDEFADDAIVAVVRRVEPIAESG